jgi:hypothetical protein
MYGNQGVGTKGICSSRIIRFFSFSCLCSGRSRSRSRRRRRKVVLTGLADGRSVDSKNLRQQTCARGRPARSSLFIHPFAVIGVSLNTGHLHLRESVDNRRPKEKIRPLFTAAVDMFLWLLLGLLGLSVASLIKRQRHFAKWDHIPGFKSWSRYTSL